MSEGMKLIWWDEISDLPSREYLVKKWLDKSCFSCVYGPSNSGKTFFTADLALHVAMGWEWRGHKVNQGAVIYIAPEGGNGLRERLQALETRYGLEGEDVPFALLPYPIDLCHEDANDAGQVCQLISQASEELDLEISLIIVDTVSRALHGGDDSSSRDMGAFVVNCDLIRQETQAHILGIHHTGKDEARGMRGSTVLISAVDTSIEIKHDKATDLRTASIEKQRDHAQAEGVTFKLEQISLGVDEDGDTVTSCFVMPSDETPSQVKNARRLTGDQQLALECLYDVLVDHGEPAPVNKYVPAGAQCTKISLWRQLFYDRKMTKEDSSEEQAREAKKKAFQRASTALRNGSHAGYHKEIAWAIYPEDK